MMKKHLRQYLRSNKYCTKIFRHILIALKVEVELTVLFNTHDTQMYIQKPYYTFLIEV